MEEKRILEVNFHAGGASQPGVRIINWETVEYFDVFHKTPEGENATSGGQTGSEKISSGMGRIEFQFVSGQRSSCDNVNLGQFYTNLQRQLGYTSTVDQLAMGSTGGHQGSGQRGSYKP